MVSTTTFSYLGLLRNQFPWLLVIFPLMIMSSLFGIEYLSSLLLPSLVLIIISTLYFTFTKQKPQIKEILPKLLAESEITVSKKDAHEYLDSISQSEFKDSEWENLDNFKAYDDYTPSSEKGSVLPQGKEVLLSSVKKEAHEAYCYMGHVHEMLDSISETEEDSETEGMNQGSVCSDGSISDEDSLIEIALPTGHYVSSNQEQESKIKLQQKMPDFMANAIFHQQSASLMELLAEINEMNEENMIEIDISMGSIKCSRFEIEA